MTINSILYRKSSAWSSSQEGIQPFVTLFHWNLPQALEDDYGGFLSPHIKWDYAALCYEKFGDRVKHWVTINDAWAFSNSDYAEGNKAPGRCSKSVGNCSSGNSGTEPYIVTHNMLLAHAAAVREYKEKYQLRITLVSHWFLPFSKDKSNKDAAQQALDFMFGWFLDPLTYGAYPQSIRTLVGDRLPQFSEDQSRMLEGSFDFLGINYYTSNYVANLPFSNNFTKSYTTDHHVKCTTKRNGMPIGLKV
ncbi:beta-glucosidase 12-like [Telopea speciosissima]|uniref:beta-glucosidase 12-like n=1 Tax=Telopea speciosissima TaxID=54955 RepID=UPI001CC79C12|nr:beta-glucosidase 12-like [Telopea speciosissima]